MGDIKTFKGAGENYQVLSALGKGVLKRMVDFEEEDGWCACGSLITVVSENLYYQAMVQPEYKAAPKSNPFANRPSQMVCRDKVGDLVNEVNYQLKRGWKVSGGLYKNYYGALSQELVRDSA